MSPPQARGETGVPEALPAVAKVLQVLVPVLGREEDIHRADGEVHDVMRQVGYDASDASQIASSPYRVVEMGCAVAS